MPRPSSDAVAAAARGGGAVRLLIAEDPEMLRQALARLLAERDTAPPGPPAPPPDRRERGRLLDRMTPREREVLVLMAQGRSNSGIADALILSRSAVAKHINAIFTKLDIPATGRDNRRVLAVLAYLRTSAPAPAGGRT
jgi:DNA-binding NarL/FixJ family response regulator